MHVQVLAHRLVSAVDFDAPPDNLPSFLLWAIEQFIGESTATAFGLWIFGWYFFVTFAVTIFRRLNEGARTVGRIVGDTFSNPAHILKDLLAGLAGTALLFLGVIWAISTYWIAAKLGSYIEGNPDGVGPMGGHFPMNVISVAYLLIAGANVLVSLWIGFGSSDSMDDAIESDFVSNIWLFPIFLMLPVGIAGAIEVIFGPDPQHFWTWIGIYVFHVVGWMALPGVWGGILYLVGARQNDRTEHKRRRSVEDERSRRIREIRNQWGLDENGNPRS